MRRRYLPGGEAFQQMRIFHLRALGDTDLQACKERLAASASSAE